MPLSIVEREAVERNSVRTTYGVKVVPHSSGRYFLRGEESGGSGKQVGHYVGFAALAGYPFFTTGPLHPFEINSQHRFVVGNVLLRVEVFRYDTTHIHTEIAVHSIRENVTERGLPYNVDRRILFPGRDGRIDKNLVPHFMTMAGEPQPMPDYLMPAFRAAFEGSRCLECPKSHIHLKDVPQIQLPEFALQALRLPAPLPTAQARAKQQPEMPAPSPVASAKVKQQPELVLQGA
jgi:hypothetical protein